MDICLNCGKARAEGEKCGCELVNVIKIDYPDDGFGIFTYLEGYKYPYPGFADQNIVDLDAVCKRGLIAGIKYLKLFLLPFGDKFVNYISELFQVAYKPLEHPQSKYLPRNRYCKSAREILRVGEILINRRWKDKIDPFIKHPKNSLSNFLWGLVMIWEFDNAYRFRGQDLFSVLNKDFLLKNARKEILRLIKLGKERENLKGGKSQFDLGNKWNLLYKMAYLCLFIPRVRNLAKEFLLELKIEEFIPTKEDWYYMSERWDYNYGGISCEKRLSAKVLEDREWRASLPKKELNKKQVALGITPVGSYLNARSKEQEEIIKVEAENFKKQLRMARKSLETGKGIVFTPMGVFMEESTEAQEKLIDEAVSNFLKDLNNQKR